MQEMIEIGLVLEIPQDYSNITVQKPCLSQILHSRMGKLSTHED